MTKIWMVAVCCGFLLGARAYAVENRTIEVFGGGQVEVEPDIARLQVGVTTMAADAGAAAAGNADAVRAVLRALEAAGVAERDMATSNFSIGFERPYPERGRDEGVYRVNNMVEVTIRNLAQVGEVMGAAMKGGANEARGLHMVLEDPRQVLVLARELAVQDARSKAEQLAKLSGEKLGRVLQISETNGGGGVGPMVKAMAMSEAAVPIRSGTQHINARLRVLYQLQ